MRTFEEWMQYQKIEPGQLTSDEFAEWRAAYEEACVRQNQVDLWTIKPRPGVGDLVYAVAIRDEHHLWLFHWIKRSSKGDYFVLIPRDDRSWNPHASYHRDGRHHQKGHDQKWLVTQRQKPDASFKGNENVLTSPITVQDVRAVKAICDVADFSDIFEIPAEMLDRGKHDIAVDLIEREGKALWNPGKCVMQKRFTACVPEILVTLWQVPLE